MKRAVKNLVLFGVMLVSLGMVVLTVLHGYGVIGKRTDGMPGDPSGITDGNFGGGQMPGRPGDNGSADGEEIGEVTLPDNGSGQDGAQTPPEQPSGAGQGGQAGQMGQENGQTPPDLPSGGFDGGQPGSMGTSGGSLGAHLAFASAWVFVFAFCLAWAIMSRCNREGRKAEWKPEPASSGTN